MKIFVFLLLLVSLPSAAWVSGDNLTIAEIVVWESAESAPLHFKLSNGSWCYIPSGQKLLQSVILTLYTAGRTAEIHCHDTAENISGGVPPAHKLHRIIAK